MKTVKVILITIISLFLAYYLSQFAYFIYLVNPSFSDEAEVFFSNISCRSNLSDVDKAANESFSDIHHRRHEMLEIETNTESILVHIYDDNTVMGIESKINDFLLFDIFEINYVYLPILKCENKKQEVTLKKRLEEEGKAILLKIDAMKAEREKEMENKKTPVLKKQRYKE